MSDDRTIPNTSLAEIALSEQMQLRLGRIEDQLTRVSDAVVSIARMDERLISVLEMMEKLAMRVDDERHERERLEQRVLAIEKSDVSTDMIMRIFWIGVTAVATGIVGGVGYVILDTFN